MPLTKPFPSPNRALLWSYWRLGRWWFALALLPIFVLKNLARLGVSPEAQLYIEWFAFLLLTAMSLSGLHSAQRFNLTLPISMRRLALVEIVSVSVTLPLLATFYWTVLSARASEPAASPFVFSLTAIVAGLMAVVIVRCSEALPFSTGVGVFAVMAAGMAALADALGPGGNWLSITILLGLCAAIAFGAIHLKSSLGRGEVPSSGLEAPAESTNDELNWNLSTKHLEVTPPHIEGASQIEHHRLFPQEAPSVVRAPFSSPVSAQVWYELSPLTANGLLVLVWGIAAVAWLGLYTAWIKDSYPGDPLPLYAASYFGLLLALLIYAPFARPSTLINRLPFSIWAQSRACFFLHGSVLAVACLVFWTIAVTKMSPDDELSLSLGDELSAPTGSLWLLVTMLWSGWVSLALGASHYFNQIVTTLYFPRGGSQSGVGVLVEILLVSVLVLAINRTTSRRAILNTMACLAAAALVGGGYALMARYAQPPRLHWICREGLGTLLVLAMLRHYTSAGLLPANVGRRLTQTLLAGAAIASVLVLILGPTSEPTRGILPTYLALGVVPPLFIPLMVIPQLISWNRFRAKWIASVQRKLSRYR